MREGSGGRYGLALVLVAGLTVAYAYHRDVYGRFRAYQKERAGIETLQDERDALVDRQAVLEKQILELSADPVEIEAAIRRTKNLVREGERIYRIELPPRADPSPQQHGD